MLVTYWQESILHTRTCLVVRSRLNPMFYDRMTHFEVLFLLSSSFFFYKKITLERGRPIENCLYLIQCKKEMIYDCQLDSYPHKTQWKGCNQLQEPYDLHKRLRGEQNIKDAHNFFFITLNPKAMVTERQHTTTGNNNYWTTCSWFDTSTL